MKKRRKFIRFDIPLRVELSAKGDMKLSSRGEALDFSREGLRITIPHSGASPNNTVELKVFLSNNRRPILVLGKIMWTKSGNDDVEMGLKIEKMDTRDKSYILDYIYKLWKDKIPDGKTK